ncbi:hypothetical protein ACS5PN_16495 [Roseateles sp. NT4]|uniref:hypothetical protein n=1 Tax=Roseateles sp. NT4 TaxID=3453715 RepID=UPI003EE9573C
MNITSRFIAGFALAAACVAAFAQTSPAVPASQPTAVGVTPDTARAANEKAVPRSDVATVVRTGPTVADKARQAKPDAANAPSNTMANGGTTVAANASVNESRAPRVDRH